MSGKFLLDTNILIALMAEETSVLERMSQADEVWLPSIVLGELYFGARRSNRTKENLAKVDELANQVPVLGIASETAREYATMKARLWSQGHPIPDNDLWIAALAKRHDLVLVSRDSHFNAIEDLSVEVW